jgi:signal transduction histidine kinase
MIFIGFFVILMLKTIVEELLSRLEKLNTDLEIQYEEVKILNESLEKKVNERTNELLQSNKDKDRILGVLSHDVNNKIGGIGSLLEIIQNEPMEEEEKKEIMKLSIETCNNTVEIIRDLLDYSIIIGDQKELFFDKIKLFDFIKSTVELHQHNAHKKNINISILNSDNEYDCCLNKLKFSRVLDNLISNAIKFTPTGGKINLDFKDYENNRVLISISDSGIGIPEKIKDKIFIPFSESGRTGTENEASNGLGLSIVKSIVDKHNGKIWFESKINEGTTFFISLPKRQETNQP